MSIKSNNVEPVSADADYYAIKDMVEHSDEAAAGIGRQLVDVFNLKKAKGYSDRYDTLGGTKTDIGVARTVLRILGENNVGVAGVDLSAGGQELADALKLKTDAQHKDRFETAWGSKTVLGVAASALAIFTAANDKMLESAHEESDSGPRS